MAAAQEPFQGWAGGNHTPPHLLLDETWYMVSARACDNLRWFEDSMLAECIGELIEEQYQRFNWTMLLQLLG